MLRPVHYYILPNTTSEARRLYSTEKQHIFSFFSEETKRTNSLLTEGGMNKVKQIGERSKKKKGILTVLQNSLLHVCYISSLRFKYLEI
jgi:hypothetical protein